MRVVGYCRVCHRIRQILVRRWNGKIPEGVCRECEEKEK